MARLHFASKVWVAGDIWQAESIFDPSVIDARLELANELDTFRGGVAKRVGNVVNAMFVENVEDTGSVYSLSLALQNNISGNALFALNIKERFYIGVFVDGMCVFDQILETLTPSDYIKNLFTVATLHFENMTDKITLVGDVLDDGVNISVFPNQGLWVIPKPLVDGRPIETDTKDVDVETELEITGKIAELCRVQKIEEMALPKLRRYRNIMIGFVVMLLLSFITPEDKPEIIESGPSHINPYKSYIQYVTLDAINAKSRLEHEVVLLLELEKLKGWDLARLYADQTTTVVSVRTVDDVPDTESARAALRKHNFQNFDMNSGHEYFAEREVFTDVRAVNPDSVYNKRKDEAYIYRNASMQEMMLTSLRYFWDSSQFTISIKDATRAELTTSMHKDIKPKLVTLKLNDVSPQDLDSFGTIVNSMPIVFHKLELTKARKKGLVSYSGNLQFIMVGF